MGIFRKCSCFCFRPQVDDIVVLDYSHCCLDDVPHAVFTHERTLEEVSLDANQIRDLPRALFHCEGLRKLNLSDNELQSIPAAISSLAKLEELNLSKNHILQIPDGIKNCKCLTIVDASINPLGPRLPDGFTQLINLQELYLNDTFLEFLPANFGRLSRLQVVELRENHLKVLPKSMARLVELRRLDIGQNDFIEFPEVVGSLHKLTEIWCDCNRIISIPSCIGNLKNLTYFDASYNKIEEISAEIGECLSLTDLTLTSNNLSELPETIGSLKNLTTLRIDENEIKCLPYSVGNLLSLEELVCNENHIEFLPSNIGLLRNLQTIIADSNKISELPFSIGSCQQLRILSIADNQLKVLPDEIGRLSCLKVLNLNSNLITYLPFSLTKITNLQALWLSENQHKPLIQFQSDIDEETGQKILTCFLLPQLSPDLKPNSPKSFTPSNDSKLTNNSSGEKQVIKFSAKPSTIVSESSNAELVDEEIDDRIATRLIRAPTPYPKELKAHARHARNLALKQKDGYNPNSVQCDQSNEDTQLIPSVSDNGETTNSSQFEIKEAIVSKSPLSVRQSLINSKQEFIKRPTSLPVSSSILKQSHEKNVVDPNNIAFVASKITELLQEESEKSEEIERTVEVPHERKESYKVAVNNSANNFKALSTIERKIKHKVAHLKDDSERGYKSDFDLYFNENLPLTSKCGYSSDWEILSSKSLPVIPDKLVDKSCSNEKTQVLTKECDSSQNKTPYQLDADNNHVLLPSESKKPDDNIKVCSHHQNNPIDTETNDSIANMITKNDIKCAEKCMTNTNDAMSNCSTGSLYPSSESERHASVSSRPSSFSSASHSHNSSISVNDISSDITNQTLTPTKSSNYCQTTTQSQPQPQPQQTMCENSTRLRHPQTASSQFIIHKFSHDLYTQPKASLLAQTQIKSIIYSETLQPKWNSNGINFIDDSNESVSSNSSNSLLNHFNNSTRLLANSNNNAHVFPVIIVKNPGLGFSIDSETGFKKSSGISSDILPGIYVSSVTESGPASTALKVGDKILQVDGIDLQNATKESAVDIFQSTGASISLMVSRDKS